MPQAQPALCVFAMGCLLPPPPSRRNRRPTRRPAECPVGSGGPRAGVAEAQPRSSSRADGRFLERRRIRERATGVEPATSSLGAFLSLAGQGFFGGGSRNGITQYARAWSGTRRFGPSSLVLEPAPDAVAGLVGLGARAHAARPQAHGRSGVHGAGPPTDARRRIEPPAGCRRRQ